MTERQRLVFRCVADGLTNKEIAEQLKISVGTVKATLQQLFTRTGVHSRSYLVRRALTREMVGTT